MCVYLSDPQNFPEMPKRILDPRDQRHFAYKQQAYADLQL